MNLSWYVKDNTTTLCRQKMTHTHPGNNQDYFIKLLLHSYRPSLVLSYEYNYGVTNDIQRITMCPHGYHHRSSMPTPALGTLDVRLYIVWIALWSHQRAQTANSERCIMQKVNVPQGGSPPNPRENSNCTGSERNIQRITMCPLGYHHSDSTNFILFICSIY